WQSSLFLKILLHLFPGPFRSRIVGGCEVKPHSRPYMAALKVDGSFGCGRFLIAPQWVLSAGHCNGDISVILGAHNLNAVEETQQVFGVISYHKHPGYSLVAVHGRPSEKNPPCSVAGWGWIDATYFRTPKLFETNVAALSRRKCLRFDPELTDGMMCAGSRATLCDGDSGSALLCNGVAHGIVSYSFQIPPSIYTRVAFYLPWIEATMNEY
uniref:Peptidase S1 domain-containing protein n=1 Tax=Laticauda laticaudata TaxID=8630 RepID=A0A8C5RGT7_LATLA